MHFIFMFLGLMINCHQKEKEAEGSDHQEYYVHDPHCSNESDGNNIVDIDQPPQQRKVTTSKHYQRHTPEEIARLEEFYRVCPRPDESQRVRLGSELDMTAKKVKFWFQNRRTHGKTKESRLANSQLKDEYEKLLSENIKLKEAVYSVECPECGALLSSQIKSGDLASENKMLREQINEVTRRLQEITGGYALPYELPNQAMIPTNKTTLGLNMTAAFELAESVSGELFAMATVNHPLWLPVGPDGSETLNLDEYMQNFTGGFGLRPIGFSTEATRASIMLRTNAARLVQLFMNVKTWSAFFSEIVGRASTIEVLSAGGENFNGDMQVMSAQYQLPSPFIPFRESCFLRYCKRRADSGIWIIVDVSLDASPQCSTPICRKRPSGCIIEEMPDGLLKVTWVEHVEIDDSSTHDMYKMMVSNGIAFGARRWLSVMARKCDRIHCMSNPNGYKTMISTIQARSILRLAERMALQYYGGTTGNTFHRWTEVPGAGDDEVRIQGQINVDDPCKPIGTIVSASTSFQLPVGEKIIFDFLHHEASRDLGGSFKKLAQIDTGKDEGNRVSLFHIQGAQPDYEGKRDMLLIQESWSNVMGSYLIYATLPITAINMFSTVAEEVDNISILPSGYAVFPEGPLDSTVGSILTMSFQLHVDGSTTTTQFPVDLFPMINARVKTAIYQIRNAFGLIE